MNEGPRSCCEGARPFVEFDSQIKTGEWSCGTNTGTTNFAFERSSKRRKGFPSEVNVKRGTQIVHGGKELVEKLGRNDLCPCGSGRRFQAMLSSNRQIRWG